MNRDDQLKCSSLVSRNCTDKRFYGFKSGDAL